MRDIISIFYNVIFIFWELCYSLDNKIIYEGTVATKQWRWHSQSSLRDIPGRDEDLQLWLHLEREISNTFLTSTYKEIKR